MAATEESVEGRIPTSEQENKNENKEAEHVDQNAKQVDGIWIDLNESKNKNSSELLQTVKNLQA